MKIWQKNNFEYNDISLKTEGFTVGNDRKWDMRLAEFDVVASLAHALMLHEVGIITQQECIDIQKGLSQLSEKIHSGQFRIEEHIEDVHSQIEKELIESIGEAGKKFIPDVLVMTKYWLHSNYTSKVK